jgi:hypothetical protein
MATVPAGVPVLPVTVTARLVNEQDEAALD